MNPFTSRIFLSANRKKEAPPCDAIACKPPHAGQCAEHRIATLHFYYNRESAKRMPENGH
jgi:hypothetical protein